MIALEALPKYNSLSIIDKMVVIEYYEEALRLGESIASKSSQPIDNKQLQVAIAMALCEAVTTYVTEKVIPFLVHAYFYIKGNILRLFEGYLYQEALESKKVMAESVLSEDKEEKQKKIESELGFSRTYRTNIFHAAAKQLRLEFFDE